MSNREETTDTNDAAESLMFLSSLIHKKRPRNLAFVTYLETIYGKFH